MIMPSDVTATIVEEYNEDNRKHREDGKLKWQPLQDNDTYEVSNRGDIRKIGAVYVLTPKVRDGVSMVANFADASSVRVFKNGVPYFLNGKAEAIKVFGRVVELKKKRTGRNRKQ